MKLLVSVIDAAEAVAAVQGGAQLIDVKNPHEGPMGAGAPGVIRAVRDATPGHLEVSAALGDLPLLTGTAAMAAVGAAEAGAAFVKVGLRWVRTEQEAEALLGAIHDALEEFRPGVKLVACAYADADRLGMILPEELPDIAAAAGCAGLLLDTHDKSSGDLFDYMDDGAVRALIDRCHECGLFAALAGGLKGQDLVRAAGLGPDIVGVRTAVCRGGDRATGRVTANAVAEALSLLQPAPRFLP
jgi:uncharacterized protein (UPF0264 family)